MLKKRVHNYRFPAGSPNALTYQLEPTSSVVNYVPEPEKCRPLCIGTVPEPINEQYTGVVPADLTTSGKSVFAVIKFN